MSTVIITKEQLGHLISLYKEKADDYELHLENLRSDWHKTVENNAKDAERVYKQAKERREHNIAKLEKKIKETPFWRLAEKNILQIELSLERGIVLDVPYYYQKSRMPENYRINHHRDKLEQLETIYKGIDSLGVTQVSLDANYLGTIAGGVSDV